MSINKFQEKIFRTGCGAAVLYVCAAIFFGSMFYTCALGGRQTNGDSSDNRLVAVDIGGNPIYADDFNRYVDSERQQALASGSPDSASKEADIQGRLLNQLITMEVADLLAHKEGAKFTDAAISAEKDKQVDQELMEDQFRLSMSKQLKPGASAADFDAAFKKATGMTTADYKKTAKEQLVKNLKDEKIRPELEREVAQALLIDALQAKINPTLEELKATYNDYQFKRILFVAHPGSTVDSEIAKVQTDLKGGATFEQEIDRYSGDSPMKGQKLSDHIIDEQMSQMDQDPTYKTLKDLKPGQVSDVVDTPQGKAIYKLIGIKNTAPPDLATKKATYAQTYANQKAQTEYDAELKAFIKSDQIKWPLPGFKALFDWNEIQQDYRMGPAERTAKMAAVVEEAKKAAIPGRPDANAAMLAWYSAFDSVWTAPGADKAKLRGDRIDLLKAITSVFPFFDLKLELVDLLIDAKQGDDAVSALEAAAGSNFAYDVEGQRDFQEVQSKLMKLKTAGLIKPAQEAEIQKIQNDWLKQNEQAQKDQQDAKKAQEEERQKEAADQLKQKAEMEKQKAADEKAAKSKAATPTVPAGTAPTGSNAAGGSAKPTTPAGTTSAPTTPSAPPKGQVPPPGPK